MPVIVQGKGGRKGRREGRKREEKDREGEGVGGLGMRGRVTRGTKGKLLGKGEQRGGLYIRNNRSCQKQLLRNHRSHELMEL